MIKILGFICIIAGGSGIGYSMSRQISRRYEELQNLQRMTGMLAGEITYGNTPLPEALSSIGRRLDGSVAVFLDKLSENLMEQPHESLAILFEQKMRENLEKSQLQEKDLEALSKMGSFLGYLDRDMQLRTLKLYQTELEREIQDTYKSMPGKKKLYQSIGIMGGLFLVILLL